ncbi:hypothetical protein BJ912DRAFT_1060014 [Pholiota molesta]|nr:hypothetical protein BJ912DRAFT_1060014 [Pholiota molesta]
MTNEPSQPRSPINDIPTEILCEIFARCVDQSSVHAFVQPNTQIAPMSLCQVCATWRAVVRATPPFWAHLRFELPLDWHANGRPYTEVPELLARRVEWLRWWRRHLGAMAPSIHAELRQVRRRAGTKYRRGRLSEPAAEFLLELLSSAQWISVGRLYRYLVQRHQEAGYVVATHRRAHTVVATWTSVSEFGGLAAYNQYLHSLVTQAAATPLRCFAIENAKLGPRDFASPLNWSMLTHLSTLKALVHLTTWHAFIRSLGALQAGAFHLDFRDSDIATYPRPAAGTLPALTMLHIDAAQSKDAGQYPLRAALDNLQLPALRTLSLKSRARTWYGATALAEVDAALASAPAVTELALGRYFLSGVGHDADTAFFEPIRDPITQLAKGAPRLERLSFAVDSPLGREEWRPFVERVFASSGWLDLKSQASSVREVIFVASDTSQPVDMVAEYAERRLLISEVRKFVRDEVVVGFEEEGSVVARRAVWGW